MPIYVTVDSNEKVNLNHLMNIAAEFYGEAKIVDDSLQVYFLGNGNAQQFKKVVEAYFIPAEPKE